MTYNDYRECWDRAGKGETPKVPVNIDLELSTVCNLSCPMCPQTKIAHSDKQFIDIRLVMNIIDEAYDLGIPAIKLNWRGESTLHPKFKEIVQYTSGKFVDVMLNTNGMYSQYLNTVILAHIDTIIFSFDSFYNHTLKTIRPGANKDRIKFNLQNIITYKKFSQRVIVNFTQQKENYSELEAMEKFCKNRNIKLNSRIMFPRTDHDKEFVKKKVKIIGRKNCGYPFQRLVIAVNGDIYPCCVAWGGDGKIGNVKDYSINKLWNSDEMKSVRKQAKEGAYVSDLCWNCTSWQSYVTEEINGGKL